MGLCDRMVVPALSGTHAAADVVTLPAFWLGGAPRWLSPAALELLVMPGAAVDSRFSGREEACPDEGNKAGRKVDDRAAMSTSGPKAWSPSGSWASVNTAMP